MLRGIGSAIADIYRGGFKLFYLAPLIPLLAILPEAAQHVAEVAIGMFDSREAAAALGNDPIRWAFGCSKIAGLLLAMLAAARFHAKGGAWWDLRGVIWRALLVGLASNVVVALAIEGLKPILPGPFVQPFMIAATIATLPLLLILINPFLGEPTTLRQAFTRGWLAIPLLVTLLAAAYLPAFAIHLGLNRLAVGQPLPLIVPILLVDSLVVGVLAVLVGTALARGSVLAPKSAAAA